MSVRGATLASLAALLVAVAVTGAMSKQRQLGSNLVAPVATAAVAAPEASVCQSQEHVPVGTRAVRVIARTDGRQTPGVEVTVIAPGLGRVSGRVSGGWAQGSVTVPVPGAVRGAAKAKVCVRNTGRAAIGLVGSGADPSVGLRVDGGAPRSARIRMEYTPGRAQTWWSLLGTLAQRAGAIRGAAPGGATFWLWILLLAGVVAASVAALLAGVRRIGRGPRWLRGRSLAGLLVVVAALANAIAWGLIIPPFQVPDETAHFYYTNYLARTGELPHGNPEQDWYSDEVNLVLGAMDFYRVIGVEQNRQPWTPDAGRTLRAAEQAPVDRVGRGDASTATSNSPEYYLLQTAAFNLSPGSSILDRLAVMRLLSAVLSALTVACVYLFVREVLPGTPWAWTVGALGAAFQPLFGFISSGVNNDGLLYLCSAFVLLMVARCFRRGLTPRRGAVLGLGLAVGVLAKTQLIAYVPAVGLGVLALAYRRDGRATAWRSLAATAAAALAPLALYFLLGRTVWDRPPIDRLGAATGASPATLTGQLSYFWQLYLPRLPFLQDLIPGVPVRDLWGDGLIGRFGWLDYAFPQWVEAAGERIVAALAVAAVVMFVRRGRGRIGELLVYLGVAFGLTAAIAWVGYRSRLQTGTQFEQARYLLPLLPLYAAGLALATRLAGRRWGPVLGAVLVILLLGHTVFAQLLTVSRYYG